MRPGGVPVDAEIEECIRAEYARMVAVVAITTGSEARAEDSVQEAFARAWERSRRGHTFDHLAGWVVTVALNHARSGHRRHRTEERALARVTDTPLAPGCDATGETDLRLVVRDAMDDLAPRQRDAAILYYLLDIDVVTTARLLEVSEGTVKSALSRARAHLATALADRELET